MRQNDKRRAFTPKRILCRAVALLLSILPLLTTHAQDGFVGDGFGGRKWYKPSNFDAGYNVCAAIQNGQLYLWGQYAPTAAIVSPYPGISNLGVSQPNTGQYVFPYAVPGFANTKLISIDNQAGAIKTDGSGWVWGPTDFGYTPGAASNRTTFGRTPIQVIANGAYHVSAGLSHVAFVKTDGTVWSAGWNRYGNFGNGTTDATKSYTTAVQMTGITNAVRVAAHGSAYDPGSESTRNYAATIVLKRDGTVWVAGGNGTLTTSGASNTAVQVTPLSNVVDIKAGSNFGVALTASGDVYAWGERYFGVLGNGEVQTASTGIYTIPQKVAFPIGTPPIVAIETESSSMITYAIDEEGTLWAWGYQSMVSMFGSLSYDSAPTPVIAGHHVADITSYAPTIAYMTRTSDYPADQRVWFISNSGINAVLALSPKEIHGTNRDATTLIISGVVTPNSWTPTRLEDVGLSGGGVITPVTSISGITDCAATAIVGNLVPGTPSTVMLKVTATVSTTGTGTLTVSGSGLSASPNPGTYSATTTGTQTFYIPMAYDGSTLGSTIFTLSGLGSCSADLSGLTKRTVLTPITPLVNCIPFTSVTISK